MKAQASMEYIFLFGFSLILVGVLWAAAGSNVEDAKWDLNVGYAKNSLNKIIQTADSVYVQGIPSKTYITVEMPDNANAVYIEGNSVSIELWWKGFLRNVTAYSIANLTGGMNAASGKHRILVSATTNNVDIQEA